MMRSPCCNFLICVEIDDDGLLTRRCAKPGCMKVLHQELHQVKIPTEPKEAAIRDEVEYIIGADQDELG